MLTVIYGQDTKLVDSELKKILQSFNPDEIKIVKDLTNFNEFYFASLQTSLFLLPQAYVFYSNDIFSSLSDFNNHEGLLNETKNNAQNIVIITNKKPSNASKVTSFLNQVNYYEVKQLTDKNKYSYLQNLLINHNLYLDSDELDLLVNKLPNDACIIENEINKIVNYHDVNLDTIKSLVSDYRQATIFELVSYCFQKDLNSAMLIYEKFFKTDPDLNYIIHMIALQINQIICVYQLQQNNYQYNEICNILEINYYVYKNIDNILRKQAIEKIIKMIDTLYELDIKIKRNLIDKNQAFKYFLLKLFR